MDAITSHSALLVEYYGRFIGRRPNKTELYLNHFKQKRWDLLLEFTKRPVLLDTVAVRGDDNGTADLHERWGASGDSRNHRGTGGVPTGREPTRPVRHQRRARENNTLGIIFERGKITNTRCDTETKTENRLRLSMQNRFYYAEFVWSSGIGVLRLIL